MLTRQRKIYIALLFGLFLEACSPVYKITHDFSPPKTAKGLACISGCQRQLRQCNQQCSLRYKQCATKAEQQARKELPALLQAYPQKLELWLNAKDQYERDLDWYEFRHDMAEARRDRYLDYCEGKGRKRSDCFSRFAYSHDLLLTDRPLFSIPRPVKPSLASVSAKIRGLSCQQDCACNSSYRLCYSSCGGAVKSNKVCIKNCAK